MFFLFISNAGKKCLHKRTKTENAAFIMTVIIICRLMPTALLDLEVPSSELTVFLSL